MNKDGQKIEERWRKNGEKHIFNGFLYRGDAHHASYRKSLPINHLSLYKQKNPLAEKADKSDLFVALKPEHLYQLSYTFYDWTLIK